MAKLQHEIENNLLKT